MGKHEQVFEYYTKALNVIETYQDDAQEKYKVTSQILVYLYYDITQHFMTNEEFNKALSYATQTFELFKKNHEETKSWTSKDYLRFMNKNYGLFKKTIILKIYCS